MQSVVLITGCCGMILGGIVTDFAFGENSAHDKGVRFPSE